MEPWTDSGPGRESIDSARGAAAAEPFDDAEPVAKPWQPRNNAEKLKMSHLERRGIETVTSRLLSPDDVALPRAPRPSHVPRMRGVLVDEDAERARVMRLERMRAQLALPVRACLVRRGPSPLSSPQHPRPFHAPRFPPLPQPASFARRRPVSFSSLSDSGSVSPASPRRGARSTAFCCSTLAASSSPTRATAPT